MGCPILGRLGLRDLAVIVSKPGVPEVEIVEWHPLPKHYIEERFGPHIDCGTIHLTSLNKSSDRSFGSYCVIFWGILPDNMGPVI